MAEAADPGPGPAEAPAMAVSGLIDEAAIAARVAELVQEISQAPPESFTVVGLLKGSFVFVADLVRALDRAGRHPRVDFITFSSYGLGRESSGCVRLVGAPPEDIAGRAVLLVDDVADSERSRCRSTSSALPWPTSSWPATASTTPSTTATCPTWARSREATD